KQFQAIKEEADALSNTYFDTSQSYNTIKQNVHKFDLELDRLRKQETHLKNEHEEFEFEKNDGYQSETSKQTLNEKKAQLAKNQKKKKKKFNLRKMMVTKVKQVNKHKIKKKRNWQQSKRNCKN